VQLSFYGAAKNVTGSNFLLESDGTKILIDCGLFQGSHFADLQNFEPFPYDPKEIRAVVVTHAHLDHVGRLPKLYQDGFRGMVFSTLPTRDFSELLLLDSEHILNQEAERTGRPSLCTVESIDQVMRLWKGMQYHASFMIGSFKIEFFNAGHILGSAIVKIEAEGKTIIFSGDLGNYPTPIIPPTEFFSKADYCVMESTYGDRTHEGIEEREEVFEDVIEDTVKQGGVLMIPAFALERTQGLLYHLHELFEQGRVPRVPVFIDSPLAIKLTAIYNRYKSYFNEETTNHGKFGEDILNFPGLHLTLTTEESKKINEVPAPKIIIAGSGMSHGGRILHHERRYLSDPKSTLLIVGYQADGSMGRRILEGAQSVTIFGDTVPVRCHLRTISSYSAHADQPRLLEWVSPMRASLAKVFLVHGEEKASAVLAQKLRDEFAVDAKVPYPGETVTL